VDVRFGRRAGWCALVRALEPNHVVEIGTDKGLGSPAVATALLRNGHGRLITIALNPEAKLLIGGLYSAEVGLRMGDSLSVLADLNHAVVLLIHDSNHSLDFEVQELALFEPKLCADALVSSDNVRFRDAPAIWAEQTGRWHANFPEVHTARWCPDAEIKAALRSPRS
jgi:predicted O-methyltransferase YrrM